MAFKLTPIVLLTTYVLTAASPIHRQASAPVSQPIPTDCTVTDSLDCMFNGGTCPPNKNFKPSPATVQSSQIYAYYLPYDVITSSPDDLFQQCLETCNGYGSIGDCRAVFTSWNVPRPQSGSGDDLTYACQMFSKPLAPADLDLLNDDAVYIASRIGQLSCPDRPTAAGHNQSVPVRARRGLVPANGLGGLLGGVVLKASAVPKAVSTRTTVSRSSSIPTTVVSSGKTLLVLPTGRTSGAPSVVTLSASASPSSSPKLPKVGTTNSSAAAPGLIGGLLNPGSTKSGLATLGLLPGFSNQGASNSSAVPALTNIALTPVNGSSTAANQSAADLSPPGGLLPDLGSKLPSSLISSGSQAQSGSSAPPSGSVNSSAGAASPLDPLKNLLEALKHIRS